MFQSENWVFCKYRQLDQIWQSVAQSDTPLDLLVTVSLPGAYFDT